MKRALGIDLGEARIGVAVSDELGMLAHPVETIVVKKTADPLGRVAQIATQKDVGHVIIGLPKNMDGTVGAPADKARAFADKLREKVSCPVRLWDERLTSVAAQRYLHDAGRNAKQSREVIDQVAAQIILQGWLDSQAVPGVNLNAATERLKLTIAYDGRPFSGWQSQADANGVQDHIEAAFLSVAGIKMRVHGSGRTDAGVHATGHVAHADVPGGRLPPARWQAALNASLPEGIRVVRASRVRGGDDGFHARFSAKGKRYLYRIWNAPYMHPLEIGRAWHVPRALDRRILRESAALLVGRHDFARFTANRGQKEKDTVRTIRQIAIRSHGSLITLTFDGDGFLYKMVRLLTGTIVRVGEGRAPHSFIRDLLSPRVHARTHFMAVAEGLYLTRVFY